MFSLTPLNQKRDIERANMVDFYNMIDGFFNDSWSPFRSLQTGSFKVDVRENDREYVIDAELPGFSKEDIKLDLENNQLTIAAQKQEESNEQKDNYIHRERRLCSMQRSVYLGNITGENVSARFENGILNVIVPKKDRSANKTQIQIN